MQEINYAGQESSAQSSGRKKYRCRVCDGPVEWPDLVCRECWRRDREEQEWDWELYCMETDEASAKAVMGGYDRKAPRESPKLIVLCGPSHAGKTRFAQRLGDNFTVISPDEIRKRLSISFGDSKHESKVWDIYESAKCKALEKGHNVILDACHISKRARWHSLQGPSAQHRKVCVVFDLPLRIVRERCLKEKSMSLKEVERMWKDFQKNKPTTDALKAEGFDEVYFVKELPSAMQSRGILRMAHHPGEAGRLSALLSAFLPVIDFFRLHTSCAHASAHTFCFAASPPWLCRSKADGSLRQFRFGGVSLWKKSKMQSKKAVLRAAQQCIKSWLRKETTP